MARESAKVGGAALRKIRVATRKGLFCVDKRGGRWAVSQASFVGDTVTAVCRDARDGAIYAGQGLGHWGVKMQRSRDDGATWEELAAPAFPAIEGAESHQTKDGKPWPMRVEQLWTIVASNASRPGELWCGTVGGALFRSRDHGASWEFCRALWEHPSRAEWFGGGADVPAIHSVCVHPEDPDDVVVGVSCGGVWRTRDGGASWTLGGKGMFAAFMPEARKFDTAIQDPHRLAQCDAAPDRLWCQHHNGAFVSDDRGETWRSIDVPPSVFGFAVAAHPRDADTAWFVPAKKDEERVPVDAAVVVTRTRDNAASFEQLREGLPQAFAYDIVLRHALAVDATGSQLAFGSSTGGLWVSEDGGDRWSMVDARLPPVYTVAID